MTDVNLSSVLGGGGGLPVGTVAQVPASFRGPAPEGWSYGGKVLSKTDNAALFAALGHEPSWYDQPSIANAEMSDSLGRLHHILEVEGTLWGFGAYNRSGSPEAAVYRSHDGGLSWETVWVDEIGTLAGSPLRYATHYNGQFRAYTNDTSYAEEIYSNDGVNWTAAPDAGQSAVNKVILNPDGGQRFLLVNASIAYYSGTYGGSWSSRSVSAVDAYRDAVTGKTWIARNITLSSSNNDGVGVSTNTGNSFTYMDLPVLSGANPVSVVANNGVIIVGLNNGSGVFVSTDDGVTWSLVSVGVSAAVYSGAYSNGRFILKTSSGSHPIIYSDDDGATWASIDPPNHTGISGASNVVPVASVWEDGAFFMMSDAATGPRVTRVCAKTPLAGEFFLPTAPSFDANTRNIIKTV